MLCSNCRVEAESQVNFCVSCGQGKTFYFLSSVNIRRRESVFCSWDKFSLLTLSGNSSKKLTSCIIFKDFLQPLQQRRIISHEFQRMQKVSMHLVFIVWMILAINFSFVKCEIRRENCNRSYIGFTNISLMDQLPNFDFVR